MSFICVICRDLLKITEDSSPRHNQYLSANTGLATHHHHAPSSTLSNNVSSGRRKEKNDSIVATKCGHLFHYPCLSVWLSQSMNLTTDSKMRCPSCKQLIYIYELVQLFPVENNSGLGSSGGCSNHLAPASFQQKLKCMMEQLENLVRDLGKNNKGSLTKENGTPTRLQRIIDSPKKHASQWAQIINEFDLLRESIKELNSFMEEHAELGSVVEEQTKEISELRSKNEQLELANEKLKLQSDNEMETVDTTLMPIERERTDYDFASATTLQSHTDSDPIVDRKDAQDGPLEVLMSPPVTFDGNKSSILKKDRRPSVSSVRFLDPFDEFDEVTTVTVNNGSIPIHKKDLRVGDKVVWSFEGNLEIGTVKWKGFIGSQINVGVEFDRQLGLPIKDLDAIQCIFKSKPGHGRLIPVNELTYYDKSLFNDNLNSTTAAYQCVHPDFKQNGGGGLKRIQACAHQ